MSFESKAVSTLANALPEAILILDQSFKLQAWNKQAEIFFSLNSSALAQPLTAVVAVSAMDSWLQKRSKQPLIVSMPNNTSRHLSLLLRRYQSKQFLLIAQDVTHTYKLEKIRQDFVANVSHELRTPLTVIHGYLEALLEEGATLPASWQTILQQMQKQSQRMEVLVEDLLLLSRLESDIVEMEDIQRVNVAALLERIHHDVQQISTSKQQCLTLQVDKTLSLNGQAHELYSAFSNIIVNAVRYTPEFGTIDIVWESCQAGARMMVSDTGIGIAAKHIPRLTQRFYRVDKARSRGDGGTGLGLAIVKHVLIRHQAQLRIESKEGIGSRFICEFPLSRIVTGQ